MDQSYAVLELLDSVLESKKAEVIDEYSYDSIISYLDLDILHAPVKRAIAAHKTRCAESLLLTKI